MRLITTLLTIFMLASCATIVNDVNVPVAISLSDGSNGECKLTNKRVSLNGKVPSTFMVRRSDDTLRIECSSESGKSGVANIPSEVEGAKLAGSVVFFDLGLTDSITDMHRTYTPSFVVPIN